MFRLHYTFYCVLYYKFTILSHGALTIEMIQGSHVLEKFSWRPSKHLCHYIKIIFSYMDMK